MPKYKMLCAITYISFELQRIYGKKIVKTNYFGIFLLNYLLINILAMTRYRNLGGNSGVYSFENGINNITVQFHDGAVYLYNTYSTSSYNISQMQRLGDAGRGLNSFISTTVRKGYA